MTQRRRASVPHQFPGRIVAMRSRRLKLFASLLLGFVILGCRSHGATPATQHSLSTTAPTKPERDAAFYTWLPKLEFHTNEGIPLALILANTGTDGIMIVHQQPEGLPYKVTVSDKAGNVMPLTEAGKKFFGVDYRGGSRSLDSLASGHVYLLTCRLDQLFAIRSVPQQIIEYTVSVEQRVGFIPGGHFITVTAPPLRFEIVGWDG